MVSVKELIGYQNINCNIIFDMRVDFQKKKQGSLDGGHTAEAPNSFKYSSVVYRDSIRIGFLLASLHGVDITFIDLDNAYLNKPCAENIWFVGGDACGEDKGRVILIVRALYGNKYSGFLCISSLTAELRVIVLKPTMEDPNVCISETMRPYG